MRFQLAYRLNFKILKLYFGISRLSCFAYHLSLCNKPPQNVMPKNSKPFIIYPDSVGWLGLSWAVLLLSLEISCGSHQMMMSLKHARWLHSHVRCLRGAAGDWALPGHLHVGPNVPLSTCHFQQGSWTSHRAAEGSPIIQQLLSLLSPSVVTVSLGWAWVNAAEDDTKTSIPETWSIFEDWLL